jgi:hypothetical protein
MPIIAGRASAAYGAGFSRVVTVAYAGPFGAYDALATATLTASSTSIVFAGIPSGYKSLQLRMLLRADRTNGDDLIVKFNEDAGNNYAAHVLGGDGANVQTYGQASTPFIYSYQGIPGPTASPSQLYYSGVMDIYDYAHTLKNKTTKWLQGYDQNGGGNVQLTSGVRFNTEAINTISIAPRYGTNFVLHSQIALYGVK